VPAWSGQLSIVNRHTPSSPGGGVGVPQKREQNVVLQGQTQLVREYKKGGKGVMSERSHTETGIGGGGG
jgi:hypothetical protein